MKTFSFVIIMLFINSIVLAQVSITNDGTPPDNSALLDLKSTERGFLPPRMTFKQIIQIDDPAEGLIIFCTDCGVTLTTTGTLVIYINGAWNMINYDCLKPGPPIAGEHISLPEQITWVWHSSAEGVQFKWNTTNNFSTATPIGSDTSTIETGLTCNTMYTRYVWAINDCGVSMAGALTQSTAPIPPTSPLSSDHEASLTGIVWKWNPVAGVSGYKWSTARDSINALDIGADTSWAETSLTCNNIYTRYVWAYWSCGISPATQLTQSTLTDPPASPVSGAHIQSSSHIVWYWHPVFLADGYKWNTTDNFNSAIDIGQDTSKTETDLTCGNVYTRYVWAYNSCGNSSSIPLNQSTYDCCGSSIAKNHIEGNVAPATKSVTYSTVTNIPGETSKCWITSNLGSDHQATFVDDDTEASAGWYWQFNRMQGFKHDGTTRTPNTTWITPINEDIDWQAANDPCNLELGNGWRLPTHSEWSNVDVSGGWNNWTDAWNSALNIHAAGILGYSDGSLGARGSLGNYWSSSKSYNSVGWGLNLISSNCYVDGYGMAYGFTIRCIHD